MFGLALTLNRVDVCLQLTQETVVTCSPSSAPSHSMSSLVLRAPRGSMKGCVSDLVSLIGDVLKSGIARVRPTMN